MDTKNIKDEQIRKQIITASEVYRDKLAGRVFLYVYGESYFEVVFPTDRFRHLTGVNSSISAQEFYDKAKSSMLSAGQIFYDREHTYRGAKRKLPCLTMLPALTNNVVCVVKDRVREHHGSGKFILAEQQDRTIRFDNPLILLPERSRRDNRVP